MTPEVLQFERYALRTIFSGPGNWIAADDVEALHVQTRAAYNFPRVRIKAGATAVRLLCAERFL